jgi:hypothetical protein
VLVLLITIGGRAAGTLIVIGTIVLTSSKRLMLPGDTNSWRMNAVFVVVGYFSSS